MQAWFVFSRLHDIRVRITIIHFAVREDVFNIYTVFAVRNTASLHPTVQYHFTAHRIKGANIP